MRLAILVKAAGGVGTVTRYDKLVLGTMSDFFNTLTDDEIAARYVPEVS
jgi:hypothetical protein